MTSNFSIDVSELEAAAGGLDRVDGILEPLAEDTVADLATSTQAAVRREARRHTKTGRMVNNVRIIDRRQAGMASAATVKATGSVAPVIIAGQVPHTIRARRARVLAFGSGPGDFAASVRHPGTAPDPFVARGVRAADLESTTDRTAAIAAERIADAADGGI